MKYIGFIKENTAIKDAVPLDEMIKTTYNYNEEILHQILNYLDNGIIMFGWMGYSQDPKTKVYIAPDAYYTDGDWIWPGYYSYYIKNYSIEIDDDFIQYLIKNEFQIKNKLSKEFLFDLEDELSNKYKEMYKLSEE